jgi:hypothetical protein
VRAGVRRAAALRVDDAELPLVGSSSAPVNASSAACALLPAASRSSPSGP